MSIGLKQKKIIDISKKLVNKSKKFNKHKISSLTYFSLWGKNPGFERIKFEMYGIQNILNYWYLVFKNIIGIGFLNNYEILKNSQFDPKDFKKLIISRSIIENFDQTGNYKDRYFLINSKNERDTLFFLIHSGENKPIKIRKNIVIFYKRKGHLNLFFLIKYTLCKLVDCNFSIRNFFHFTSSFNRLGELINNFLKKEINFNNIKSILVPYEGQPYEHYIFEEAKKVNKKITIFGYDHTAPHAIPIHLIYRSFSPDFLFVNGSSTVNFLTKFLNWPKKRIKLVPSLRYPKKLNLNFENNVFLPYEIFNEQVVIQEFEKIIFNFPNINFSFLKIKNHPMMKNSKKHVNLKYKLEKIIEEHKKKNKKKNKKKFSIFVGPTTGVIVALEKRIHVIHICFEPVFESYNQTIWPNLNVKQISKNSFIYKLKRNNTFIKFSSNQNCYKKYYDKN